MSAVIPDALYAAGGLLSSIPHSMGRCAWALTQTASIAGATLADVLPSADSWLRQCNTSNTQVCQQQPRAGNRDLGLE